MKLLSIAILLTIVLTGCSALGGGSDSPGATDGATGATSGAATDDAPSPTAEPEAATPVAEGPCGGSLEGCFDYDEMDDYVAAVEPMVAQYFEAVYSNVPAPRDIVFIPNGRIAQSACGTSNSQAYEYCTGDQTIYIGQDLVWGLYRQAGDAAPAVALAHEWGHHLQNMLGVPFAQTREHSIAFENQADCISGAWARYAEEEGWLEPEDDVGDIETLLQLIGARESRARDHGTVEERAEAFYSSYEAGMEACNAYFPEAPVA